MILALTAVAVLSTTFSVITGAGPAGAATATFGQSTIGTSSVAPDANYKFGSSYTLAENGTTQSFSWYTRGGTIAQRFTPAIYRSDASGNPTTLVTTGAEVTVNANQAAGWVTSTLPSISLTPGSYYLGLLSGPSNGGASNYYNTVTNGGVWTTATYPTATATWGTVNRENLRWSMYVTYLTVDATAAPVNSALPAITGTAREGLTLTASSGTWTNSPTSYAYQWRRCDSAGANCVNVGGGGSTYIPSATDIGSTIRVIVTATNGIGSTPATSNATAVVTAGAPVNTALPAITGAAQQGQVLTASSGSWTNSPTSFAYQWRRCDSTGNNCTNIGTNVTTYTLVAGDVGSTIRVVVTATNAAGPTAATSAQTALVSSGPPTNSALPTISGTTQQGQTLTASSGTWTNSPTSFAYQWRRCDGAGANCANVGTNANTYVLVAGDVGSTIRVIVTASNSAGPGTATSNATAAVTAAVIPSNTALPVVSGSAQVGATLTTTNGTWTNSPTSFAYQWRRCDSAGANCTNVGTNANTYVLVAGDVGSTIRVIVTASNIAGPATATSAATGIVVSTPSRFGQTTPGALSVAPSGGYKFGSAFALAETANVQSFTWYVRGGSVSQSFVPVVYRTDASGNPTTLAVTGAAVTIAANQAANWVTSTLPTTSLTPGTYFLALLSGPTNGGASNYYDAVTNAGVYNTNTYPTPTATWGTINRENLRWSFYVSYTPAAPPAPPQNTVLPAITGTTRAGSTLTASTGTWTNSPTSFTYLWQRCDNTGNACVNLPTATSATYALTATDVDATMRVVVTATNSGGPASATSAATAVILAALPSPPVNTALPTVPGTPVQGQPTTATNGTWANSPTAFAYQWQRCNAAGNGCTNITTNGTGQSYTPIATDVGGTLRVIVTASNAGGPGTATSNASVTVLAAPPSPPVNTALPAITGSTVQGQTLTSSTGTWANSPTTFAYQWLRCDGAGANCTNVGTNVNTYLLVAGDVASTIRVTVTASNAGGPGSATSAATGVVTVPPAPVNTALPVITGTAQQGQTLMSSTGTWANSPTTFAYQWLRCDGAGSNCTNVGTNASTYTIVAGDVASTIRVTVTASNVGGPGNATSAATAVVTVPPAPVNTALPAITGTAQQGQTLTASNGTWTNSPTTFAYQWLRCDNVGSNCTNVGTNANTYALVSTDVGGTIRVTVSATNIGGTTPAMSVQTSIVAAASTRFGQTTPGALSVAPDAGYKFGSSYALAEAATVQSFSWYTRGGTGSQSFVPVIYRADASGNPTTLAVTGAAVTVAAGQAAGWVTSTLPATSLTAGTYFLTLISGPSTGQAANYYDTVANAGVWNTNAYPTPSATWGTVNREDHRWSFYVTYAPAGPPQAPVNTTLPSISGIAAQGQTLTAANGVWSNLPTSYAYSWQRCNNTGVSCTPLNVTTATYVPVVGDVGSTLRVVVTASNSGGSGVATSAATAVVTAALNYNPATFTKIVIDATLPASITEKWFDDLDNDGRPDAIVGLEAPSTGGIYWYEFPKSGNPADPWTKRTIRNNGDAYEGMITFDVNGDGFKDVIASVGGDVSWYRNPGTLTGAWTQNTIGAAFGETTMALGDFDADGRTDLMTNHSVFFQNTPTTWTEKVITDSRRGTALLDIGTGRGRINLVTTGPAPSYNVTWFENPREHGGNARTDAWVGHVVGTGYPCASTGTPTSQCPDPYPGTYEVADFNGDGRMDIVAAQSEMGDGNVAPPPGGIKWFAAPVDRTLTWTSTNIDTTFVDAHLLQIADVDANGLPDIIAGEQDQSPQRRIGVFYNTGGAFVLNVFSNDATHNIAIADVNNDGDVDILTSPHGFYGLAHPLTLWVNNRIGPR